MASTNLVADQSIEDHADAQEQNDEQDKFHPLQSEWKLWYYSPSKKGGRMDYSKALQPVHVVTTVEEYWGLFNNIVKASGMQKGKNFYFFKADVEPRWESEACKKGGNLSFSFPPEDVLRTDQTWSYLTMGCIGEHFEELSDYLLGCAVAIRKQAFRFEIWISTTNDTVVKDFMEATRKILELKEKDVFEFAPFASEQK